MNVLYTQFSDLASSRTKNDEHFARETEAPRLGFCTLCLDDQRGAGDLQYHSREEGDGDLARGHQKRNQHP